MVPPTVHDSSPNNSDLKCFIKTISSKRNRNSSDDSEVGTNPRSNRVSKPKSKRFLSGENFMKKAITQASGSIVAAPVPTVPFHWNSTFLQVHVNNGCLPAYELFHILKSIPEYNYIELLQVVRAIKECGECQTLDKFSSRDSDEVVEPKFNNAARELVVVKNKVSLLTDIITEVVDIGQACLNDCFKERLKNDCPFSPVKANNFKRGFSEYKNLADHEARKNKILDSAILSIISVCNENMTKPFPNNHLAKSLEIPYIPKTVLSTPDIKNKFLKSKKVTYKQPISKMFSPARNQPSVENFEILIPANQSTPATGQTKINEPSESDVAAWNKFLGGRMSRSLDLTKFNISGDSVNTENLDELLDDFDAENFDFEKAAREHEEKFCERMVKKEAK